MLEIAEPRPAVKIARHDAVVPSVRVSEHALGVSPPIVVTLAVVDAPKLNVLNSAAKTND